MTNRTFPYDLVFDSAFEAEHFAEISAEAEQRGITTWEPEQFLLLRAVAAPLRSALAGDDASGVEQFAPLLFQGYHYWRYEKQQFVLTEPLFRLLVGELRIGEWEQVPLAPAGYVQLPRNLLWARIDEATAPEAVDGFFWTMVGTGDARVPPFARVDVLLVLGVLPSRPGFSVIPLNVSLSEPQGHWGDEQARPEGQDFANNLPGGELQALHAIETTGEVWKFVSRVFWYGAQNPAALAADTRELRLVNRG